MADGNITVEVSTQAAQAELERLRAENARLAREAHAWWTAARDATVAERERCAQRVARWMRLIRALSQSNSPMLSVAV